MVVQESFEISNEFEEGDWEILFHVHAEAFKNDELIRPLYPGGLGKANREANLARFRTGLFEGPIERLCAKVSYNGKPIAFVSSRVYRGKLGIIDDGDGKVAPSPPPVQLPQVDSKDRAWIEWYFNSGRELNRAMRELHIPLVYVQVLATHPDWQRHGAGTKLLEWIFEWMRKERTTRCALNTPKLTAETQFYQHRGFEAIDEHTYFDKKRFPERNKITQVVMVKDV